MHLKSLVKDEYGQISKREKSKALPWRRGNFGKEGKKGKQNRSKDLDLTGGAGVFLQAIVRGL